MTSVPDELHKLADLYAERNKVYGDNYKQFGPMMAALFPDGLCLRTADDFARFGMFIMIMTKASRYANAFAAGGHDDTLDDLSVYSQMQKELDHEAGHND